MKEIEYTAEEYDKMKFTNPPWIWYRASLHDNPKQEHKELADKKNSFGRFYKMLYKYTYRIPFDKLPLHINDKVFNLQNEIDVQSIIKWRLKIQK
jgi:hypothetical protein